MSDTVEIPLHSKRRSRVVTFQHLQHGIPAFGLAASGLAALRDGAHGFEFGLAIAEIVTSTILVVALIRHLRHGHGSHGHQAGPDWLTVFAAAMLFTEAGEKYQRSGKIWSPQTLTALATLFSALPSVVSRRQRRRMLTVSPDGITIRHGRLRKRFSAKWSEIAAIEIGDHEAWIHTHRGDRGRVHLHDLHNAHEVAAALRAAQQRLPPP